MPRPQRRGHPLAPLCRLWPTERVTGLLALSLSMSLTLTISTMSPNPSLRPLPASATAACPLWRPPVAGQVSRGFALSDTWRGPGHRGVDFAATPGTAVSAVAAGTVAFAGRIAGRGVLVIEHPGHSPAPLRSTYEPVEAVVQAGELVAQGQRIGSVGTGGHCDGECLHLGARIGSGRPASYRSPAALLICAPVLKPMQPQEPS